jgi:hypothetical protein
MRSPKKNVGAGVAGSCGVTPPSSRYCAIIIAWLRSSSACA